jgi:hypothetical protein
MPSIELIQGASYRYIVLVRKIVILLVLPLSVRIAIKDIKTGDIKRFSLDVNRRWSAALSRQGITDVGEHRSLQAHSCY